jgi:hypothetical protein
MTRHVFRLATPADEPAIRRLQSQFIAEMNDPLGIDENARPRTDLFLVEVVDQSGRRAVGMALPTWVARLGIQRSQLVEGDWGYIEQPYRGQGLAPLLFAGMMLHTHHHGHAACVGMPNEASLARLPRNTFHTTGLATHLAGTRYELGLFVLAEIATLMSEIVQAARARDPRIVWQLPTGAVRAQKVSRADSPVAPPVNRGTTSSVAPGPGSA